MGLFYNGVFSFFYVDDKHNIVMAGKIFHSLYLFKVIIYKYLILEYSFDKIKIEREIRVKNNG